MNEYKNFCRETEREISLIDLFFYMLSHWRSLIAAVLIGVLLGCGICFLKVEMVEMTPEQAILSGAYVAPPEMQIRMSQGSQYRKLYDKQAEYLRESFLMQMDSNRVYTGTAKYYLAAGDNTRFLSENLKNILNDNELILELRNIVGVEKEPQYIRELSGCQVVWNESLSASADQESYIDAVITYTVSFGEEMKCNEILQVVERKAEAAVDEFQKDYEISKFERIHDGIELIANQDIMLQQKTATDNANTYITNYVKAENECCSNPLDAAYYYINYLNMDTTGIEAYSMGAKVPMSAKTVVKWLLVGMILSVGLWGVWHGVRYLLDKSVKTAEEVKNNYGLPLLGYMETEAGNQNAVDRWIEKCSGKYRMSPDSLEYIRKTIDSLDKESIILCDGRKEESEQLLKNITSDKTSLHVSEFVHQSGEALQAAKNSDGEILIIRRGKTCHQEIVRELEVCSMQEIMVLGAIVIG